MLSFIPLFKTVSHAIPNRVTFCLLFWAGLCTAYVPAHLGIKFIAELKMQVFFDTKNSNKQRTKIPNNYLFTCIVYNKIQHLKQSCSPPEVNHSKPFWTLDRPFPSCHTAYKWQVAETPYNLGNVMSVEMKALYSQC